LQEKLGYVVSDFDGEMKNVAMSSENENTYELPDGQVVSVGTEKLKCTEALFQPSLIEVDKPGLHKVAFDSIMQCKDEVQDELFGNILLSN
jgi:actin-related protein